MPDIQLIAVRTEAVVISEMVCLKLVPTGEKPLSAASATSAQLPQLVDVQTMARALNVSPSWLYQRTRQGHSAIPFYAIGRHVRFDPEEVLAFFRAKRDPFGLGDQRRTIKVRIRRV